MSKYTSNEIEIFKRVIIDYYVLKKEIDKRIEENYTMENFVDYIRHLASCNITNCEIDEDVDYKYIDFNYCDMNISIIKDYEEKIKLNDYIEIWNDKEEYYVDTLELKEIERIVESEGK